MLMDSQKQPGQFNPQQYDFITNHQEPKKSLIPSVGSGKTQRIIFAVIAGLLFIMVAVIIYSLIFGGSTNKDQLISVAGQQTELIRVSELGTKKSNGTDAKSLAASVQVSVTSDKNSLIEQMKKNGDKVSDKDLVGSKSSETDKKLTDAEQNGTFDTIFTSTMNSMLQKYQANLKVTFEATKSKATKQVLSNAYENAGVLVEQSSTK